MIVVFTHRDELEYHKVSEDEFLNSIPKGTNIKALVNDKDKCNNRYIFFNNNTRSESDKEAQTEKLLQMVEKIAEDQTDSYSSDLQGLFKTLIEENQIKTTEEFRSKVIDDMINFGQILQWLRKMLFWNSFPLYMNVCDLSLKLAVWNSIFSRLMTGINLKGLKTKTLDWPFTLYFKFNIHSNVTYNVPLVVISAHIVSMIFNVMIGLGLSINKKQSFFSISKDLSLITKKIENIESQSFSPQ